MTRKRVLMIIPELMTGGAQRSFSQLSRDFSERYEVHVAIFNNSSPVKYETNATLHSLNVDGGRNVIDKMIAFFKRVHQLKKIKRKIKPDFSLSFLEGADYINILSSIGEPTMISIRGTKMHDLQISGVLGYVRKKILIPYLYKKASHIVTVSEYLKTEMVVSFGISAKKISTIYNYYDINKIKELSKKNPPINFNINKKSKVIVNVGRLHLQKNQIFLVNLFKQLKTSENDFRLIIIGDGPLRNDLVSHAKATKLRVYTVWDGSDSETVDFDIYFMGEQSNPYAFFKYCDLFILTSKYEGFPNVLVEAIACELPVISADCPYGPREILSINLPEQSIQKPVFSPFGVLMPPSHNENLEQWAKVVYGLLTDKKSEANDELRDRALFFCKENILQKWHNLLDAKLT